MANTRKMLSVKALGFLLGMGAVDASALSLDAYDLNFSSTGGSSFVFRGLNPSVGPEVEGLYDAWSFDMTGPNSFDVTFNPLDRDPNLRFRFDIFVYVSNLRYNGSPDSSDILSLTLQSGTASDVTNIITDGNETAFGDFAMQFNIDGEGGFGEQIPAETWSFAFTTDAAPIPLPAGLPLLLAGLGGLAALRRLKG